MKKNFAEDRRNIASFLIWLRYSIDRTSPSKLAPVGVERENFFRSLMMVEEARIRFTSSIRYDAPLNRQHWNLARDELFSFLSKFKSSDFISAKTFQRKFFVSAQRSRDLDKPTEFMLAFMDEGRDVTIGEAIARFDKYLKSVDDWIAEGQGSLTLSDLDQIVPDQKLAPAQFDIKNNVIFVLKNRPATIDANIDNISQALDYLCDQGKKIIENLSNSNCDVRLLETVKQIHNQITDNDNIVKIGLSNINLGAIASNFYHELPDALSGMIGAYNSSVSLYVAQFPEWQRFTENASYIELDDSDIDDVEKAAEDTLSLLKSTPDLAHPEVPMTIELVLSFLSNPKHTTKRAIFALIRTLENFVASIIKYSLQFFKDTASKFKQDGSTALSKSLLGLLALAIVAASGIGPAAMQTGAPWVSQASEIIRQQIQSITK